MSAPPVVIGDVIAGKYVVERIIGEGGMGVVLAARHLELEQRVAIKFLLPEIAEQGMAAERFRREARAAARIRGQHICRVLDVGTLETGVPFMVMEYLEGCDLASELEQRGRLPCEEAIGYVLQACEALAEAHATGVIHRDLKPANLFLEACGDGSRRVKVLDFGVSKSLLDGTPGRGAAALTKTSSLVGSPLYMSPEQLDSARDVDARTDIWALGVVLYELIAGRTPFQGDSIPQLVTSVLHDPPRSLSDQDVTVPNGLEAVLWRALSKQRAVRYASVAEFVNALMPFAPPQALGTAGRVSRLLSATEPLPASALPSPAPANPARVAQAATPARAKPRDLGGTPLSWVSSGGQPKRRRLWASLIALVAVGLLAGGYVAYRGSNATGKPAAVASPPAEVTTRVPEHAAPPAAPAPVPALRGLDASVAVNSPESPAGPQPPAADVEVRPQGPAAVVTPTAASKKPVGELVPKPSAAAMPAAQNVAPVPAASVPLARPRARVEPPAEPVRPVKAAQPANSISDFGGRR
jgi:eukaryotic-like serine/threonine-protein kinase